MGMRHFFALLALVLATLTAAESTGSAPTEFLKQDEIVTKLSDGTHADPLPISLEAALPHPGKTPDGPKDYTIKFMKTGALAEALAVIFLVIAISICCTECKK